MKQKKLNILGQITIFLCILLKYLISYSVSMKYLYVLLVVIIFFSIATIINKKIYKKEFFFIIIFMFFALYFVILYQDVNFFISVCLAILFLKKDIKTCVKTFLYSSIILFCMTILLNKANILQSNNMIRNTSNGIVIRHSLGFSHPNEVFLFFLPIALSLYYIYEKRSVYMIIIFASCILYFLSYSRTGIIAIIILLLLNILIKNKKYRIQDKISRVMPYVMLFFTVFSIFVAIRFGNDNNNIISKVFSGRPYYWNYYIKNDLLFSFFGKNFIVNKYLDNYYIYILVELGLLSYIIYSFIYYKYYKKYFKQLERKEIVVALVFFIYGLCETNIIIGSINFLFAKQISDLIDQEKIAISENFKKENKEY